MLACARLGLTHSVVFGGFSAEALRSRIDDAEAKLVITADGQYRRGKPAPLKAAVDEAVDAARRRSSTCWWCGAPRSTSSGPTAATCGGTTLVDGQSDTHTPGGVRRRAPAVHPVHVRHHREAEGHPAHLRRLPDPGRVHAPQRLRPQAGDRRVLVHRRHRLGHRAQLHRLRTAGERRDRGGLRGHPEHPARGPALGDRAEVRRHHLLHGADADPHVHEVGRTTSPTKFDLSSLRVLGSVGEPINPEAWIWYRENIGGDRTPIVDTWWQTETGAIMISPLPGVTAAKPGSAQRGAAGHLREGRRRQGQRGRPTAAAGTWCSTSRGRRCCAASGATRSGTGTPTGRGSPTRASTSPATARSTTRTATSGCSAGSTT